MSTTLKELVRNQIEAEGPDFSTIAVSEAYIDEMLNSMTNVELLERISESLQHGVRTQWMFLKS